MEGKDIKIPDGSRVTTHVTEGREANTNKNSTPIFRSVCSAPCPGQTSELTLSRLGRDVPLATQPSIVFTFITDTDTSYKHLFGSKLRQRLVMLDQALRAALSPRWK